MSRRRKQSGVTSTLINKKMAGRATAEEIHRIDCVVHQARFAAVLTAARWVAGLESGEAPERSNILRSFRQAKLKS